MASKQPKFADVASTDLGDTTNLLPAQPVSPVHPRQTYRRQPSGGNLQHYSTSNYKPDGSEENDQNAQESQGLGIFGAPTGLSGHSESQSSIPRIPVGSRPDRHGSNSMGSFLSPSLPGSEQNTPGRRTRSVAWEDPVDGRDSSPSGQYSPYIASNDAGMLNDMRSPSTTLVGTPEFPCPTDRAIIDNRWSWLTVSIMALAIYTTIFSGVFLGIAIARPRWGRKIGTDNHMTISTASLLSAFFSKSVELAFVTVFIAFLGQALSRKAFRKHTATAGGGGGGITIAEISMRSWVMQPGTLITHWEAVRWAGFSILGVIALMAAFMAMFYTTACEALVAPKLRTGPWEDKVFNGEVVASFANSIFLAQDCQTPVSLSIDPEYAGSTCLQIQHAGEAYHNYQLYLAVWATQVGNGNASSKLQDRPPPIGVLHDNTTIQGQFLSIGDITADSLKYERLVQNLSMAMPMANVISATGDPSNDIMQPEDGTGLGDFEIAAGVPAPTVNILCAGLTADEVANFTHDSRVDGPIIKPNTTAVDEIFGFGSGPPTSQVRPTFAKVPLPYNTVLNEEIDGPYGMQSIYILATPDPAYVVTAPHLLCAIRGMQYSNCTTRYKAANTGGHLSVHCDMDPLNTHPYRNSIDKGVVLPGFDPEVRNVASEWARALSLSAGVTDGNASNARLLNQMVPPYDNKTYAAKLSPLLPSIAEALAVMSGCVLLVSSQNSPFVHFWNYTAPGNILKSPQTESFNGSLRFTDYASGGTQRWQGIFYVVLFAVFATNVFCLFYLAWTLQSDGQVTDYTEPQNMFALAVNSPPSRSLSGACGGGPAGHMLGKKWEVDMQRAVSGTGPPGHWQGHPHFYVKCRDDDRVDTSAPYTRVREKRSRLSLRSMDDYEMVESPAVEQYMKLAKKGSSIL